MVGDARGFPGGFAEKNLPASMGNAGSIPGLERCPREGNSNPLQYSCLGNVMDREAWQATVHGFAKRRTTERLHNNKRFKASARLEEEPAKVAER